MPTHIQKPEPEQSATVTPWRNRKIRVRVAGGIVATVVALFVGLLVVYPRIEKWRKDRILRSAEAYLVKEDYRSAYLLMEQFVRKDPMSLVARRLLARVNEVIAPEQALIEWESLVQIEPGNPDNYVGYATTALKVGQPARLPPILAALQKLEPEGMEYHRLAAGSALAMGDSAELRKHIERLATLEPQNPLTRFSLAALQLNSIHPPEHEPARNVMAEFARGDGLRIRATLALIADAPRRWPDEKTTARLYARLADALKLRDSRGGSATRYVSIQGFSPRPTGLSVLLEHMKAQPSLSANDVQMLTQWMLQIGQGREALLWLDTLDEPLRATNAVRQGMVACAVALESWPRLEQLLSHGAWGPVPAEAMKLAFAARALRAGQNASKAGSQWNSAIRLCEQSQPGLRVLQRLALIWHWPDKQAQVLWVLVRQFPVDESAWRTLAQLAQAEGSAAELWRIYQAWVQAAPPSPAVQAERALIGLLIRTGETGLDAKADELFRQHPEVPGCRVARALALWRAGRAAEGLALLNAGEMNYAREPRFALVRGLILATLGRKAESEDMFALVQNAKLLPEESALVAQARQSGR